MVSVVKIFMPKKSILGSQCNFLSVFASLSLPVFQTNKWINKQTLKKYKLFLKVTNPQKTRRVFLKFTNMHMTTLVAIRKYLFTSVPIPLIQELSRDFLLANEIRAASACSIFRMKIYEWEHRAKFYLSLCS